MLAMEIKVWSKANPLGIAGEHQLLGAATAEGRDTQMRLMVSTKVPGETGRGKEGKKRQREEGGHLPRQGKHRAGAVVALVD